MATRPPFSPFQRGLIAFWSIFWAGFVLWVWYPQRHGGGWFDATSVAVLAAIFFGIGVGVLVAIVVVARFILARERIRTWVLITVPGAIAVTLVVWVLATAPRYRPEDTYATGLVIDELPENWHYSGAEMFYQRGYFHEFESDSGDIMRIGTLDHEYAGFEGEATGRDDRLFYATVEDGENRVLVYVQGIPVEVASETVSHESLEDIAATIDYDPEWDVRDE